MDRTAWIVIAFCVIGLVAWEWWVAKHAPPRPSPVSASPTITPPLAGPSLSPLPGPSPFPSSTPAAVGSVPAFAEKVETLRNGDVELRLTNRGGAIAEAVLLNHIAEDDKRVTLNAGSHTPIGAIVEDPSAPDLPEYRIARQSDTVTMERVTAQQLTIRKTFLFPTAEKKDNFAAQLNVDLVNGSEKPYLNRGYFLAVGSAAPIHKNDYMSFTRLVWCVNGSAKGVDVSRFAGSSGFFGILGQRPPEQFFNESVNGAEWVATSDQFFTTLVAPLTGKSDAVWAQRFDIDPARRIYGLEGAMHMPGFELGPGQTYSARFEIYLGPKLYHKLATLSHNEAEVMEFGFFKIISQALLNALNTLHGVLGNYAAAILALTTIVKLVLWPIQNKATKSARQMGALAPKMQELREKYKDDPTRMNQELMKLYKEYGINPVGGCLPMFIQIPIFFGLFTMLRQAVELRNASFLWIHDLSQPDTVAHLPVVGWPLNILPLIMAATSFWMTHLTPKSGDPTQQRMMMFTPIIFIVFCYNFAAALALYYTTQNLLTIVQLYHNRKQPLPTLERVQAGKRKTR